jgi:hypothetical protein
MLLTSWDPAIITKALSCLTDRQRELLPFDIELRSKIGRNNVGPKNYKERFGFSDLETYRVQIEHISALVRRELNGRPQAEGPIKNTIETDSKSRASHPSGV